MRIRLVALMSVLAFVAQGAFAEPKDDVAAATAAWAEAVAQNDPDNVVLLYAPDACFGARQRRSRDRLTRPSASTSRALSRPCPGSRYLSVSS